MSIREYCYLASYNAVFTCTCMYCLSVVYISVISFSDTGEETQQSSPVASRNRFCPWGLRCSLHVERSPRFPIIHVYYVRVLVMSARNDLYTQLTKAVRVTSSVSNLRGEVEIFIQQ